MPLYRVRKGTACLLRTGRKAVFMPHTLQRDAVFHKGRVEGGSWFFKVGMYTYRIPQESVVGPSKDRTPPFEARGNPAVVDAHLRAVANSPPASKPCGIVAPGSGVDEWREGE